MTTPPHDPQAPHDPPAPQEPAAALPAPGWYDDPTAPGRPRWWDGTRWAPPSGPPPGYPGGAPAPGGPARYSPVDIEGEQRSGRGARIALLVGIVAYGLSAVLTVIVADWVVAYFRDVFDAVERGDTVAPDPPPMTELEAIANLMTNVTSIGTIVTGVFFIVWFYRSATNARKLGLPARLSPGWTIFGFVVPVVSLWFPCWSALGLFPKDHAGRRLVIRWWLAWLAAGFLTNGALVALLFGSRSLGLILAGVDAVLYLIAGLLARQLISEAGEVHRALAVQAGIAPAVTLAPGPAVDPWAKAAERKDDPWSTP